MVQMLIVAVLIFVTSIDSILLIKKAVDVYRYPDGKLRWIILLIMGTMHPLYSYLVDSFRYIPGLRIVLAAVLVYFAFRMAGESPVRSRL